MATGGEPTCPRCGGAMVSGFDHWNCTSLAAENGRLLAEIERLRGALERILAEHQQIVGDTRSYCLICAPGDGHYPCVTVLEAREVLGVGNG